MTTYQMINFIIVSIILAGTCYLYFWLYKDHVVDAFRQSLFELRDNLFDEAADGLIEFNHPAYCSLRRLMNGYIRFSHQLNLFNTLLWGILVDKKSIKMESDSFENNFQSSLSNLDEKTQERLGYYKKKLRWITAFHILAESPLIILSLLILIIVLSGMLLPLIFLIVFYEKIQKNIRRLLLGNIKNIESEAFALGKL